MKSIYKLTTALILINELLLMTTEGKISFIRTMLYTMKQLGGGGSSSPQRSVARDLMFRRNTARMSPQQFSGHQGGLSNLFIPAGQLGSPRFAGVSPLDSGYNQNDGSTSLQSNEDDDLDRQQRGMFYVKDEDLPDFFEKTDENMKKYGLEWALSNSTEDRKMTEADYNSTVDFNVKKPNNTLLYNELKRFT